MSVGRDSSVGIATGYSRDGPGIESRWGGEIFRTRPDRAWCWPPTLSSAEVKERVDLYLYSPSGPYWPVIGWPLHLLTHHVSWLILFISLGWIVPTLIMCSLTCWQVYFTAVFSRNLKWVCTTVWQNKANESRFYTETLPLTTHKCTFDVRRVRKIAKSEY
jgi:hypothetical protein